MKIYIDRLNESELIDLNRRIVERLRFLSQMRAHAGMLQLGFGDRVSFTSDGRPAQKGVVAHNKKTVTAVTEGGEGWTVSPHLLMRVVEPVHEDAPLRDARGTGDLRINRSGKSIALKSTNWFVLTRQQSPVWSR